MKIKKIVSILLLVSLLTFVFAACGENKNNETQTTTFTDMIGRNVEINTASINRIVCIGAGALRLYSYIGDMEKIVGAEDIDRNQDDADVTLFGAGGFKNISRPYYDYNKDYLKTTVSVGLGGPRNQVAETEKIIAANPDLIISEYEDVEKENKLQSDTKTPVITVKYGNNHNIFDETLFNSLTLLGKILNKESRANELISFIKSSETELKEKVKDVNDDEKQSAYIGCIGNWGTQDILSTNKNFALFNVSSVKNAVVSNIELNSGKITLEKLVDIDPDVIFLDAAGINVFKNSDTYANKKNTILSLTAVQNSNVYLQMPFNAYYTNIEVALMDAYYIASIMYPEQYKDFNIETKSTEILKKFLGDKATYSLVKDMPLSFGGFQKITNLETFLGK